MDGTSAFVLFVGIPFCFFYGLGWLLEQRELTREIERRKTENVDFLLSPKGRALINSFAKLGK